jgi:hypothetical protein
LHPTSRKLKPAERKQCEALETRIAELDEKLQEADDETWR